MTSKYRIAIQLSLDITDEAAFQQAVHDEAAAQIAAAGGIAPNEFVDNDNQAADHIAQDQRMAVSMAVMRLLRGGAEAVPGAEFSNVQIQNEPIE